MLTVIVVSNKACLACRLCEVICSLKHYGEVNPRRSRIRVSFDVWKGVKTIHVCQHCEEPLCVDKCPNDALRRDEQTGLILVDEEKCNGCGVCVSACPYGALWLDPIERKPLICDLCGGEPLCISICPVNALFAGLR